MPHQDYGSYDAPDSWLDAKRKMSLDNHGWLGGAQKISFWVSEEASFFFLAGFSSYVYVSLW